MILFEQRFQIAKPRLPIAENSFRKKRFNCDKVFKDKVFDLLEYIGRHFESGEDPG